MSLQGVDRTLGVLEALASAGEASLADVAHASKLPKSATHRVLQSLLERGYATKDPHTGRYRPGLRVLDLITAGLNGVDLRRTARPALERLASATGEAVHLVVRDDDAVVYVDKVESTHPVRMASRIGMRGALHSTACGKAILAALPEDEVGALISRCGLPARTRNTIVSVDALFRHLAQVRARGYALDDEENESDVRCVGKAILGDGGRPVGAVSVSAPAYRLARDRAARLAPLLAETVAEVSGHRAPAGGAGNETTTWRR